MENYVNIKSPFTGGRVLEVCTTEVHEFRKEKYTVHVRYYKCEDTGEQFTTGEQDELVLNDLYGQYREKHGVPFPDEIRAVRTRFGLNYTQIGKILGFGMNQYAQYEKGEVPSESNGKMIRTAGKKANMLMLLENSREEFDANEYEKIRMQVLAANDEESDAWEKRLFFGMEPRSIYNGFGQQDPERVKNLVRYLVQEQFELISPTRLNKLLFYIDFAHYRRHGRSVSGLRYRAIQYGPVPEHYETIYDHVDGLEVEVFLNNNVESRALKTTVEADMSAFAQDEMETIAMVLKALGMKSTGEVVQLSHQEEGWLQLNATHGMVPYTYAFSLKGV